MSRSLLKVSGLQASYGLSQVLFGVDLSIQSGESVGLLGRNGMGKSTLLKCILGLKSHQHGEVEWQGQSLKSWSVDRIANLGLAVVPEGRHVFPNLTVHEHLTAFAKPARPGAPLWDAPRVYQLFGRLSERQHHLGRQLSGGEQQMLAIGRALVTNPQLLILDEASEGLAPLIREEIWNCLRLLRNEGQTLIIVDKYVERLIEICDRHVILERGAVSWCGSSNELSNNRELWHRYLGV
jgi:branched-chain amino acid transport system ATP-binding protein